MSAYGLYPCPYPDEIFPCVCSFIEETRDIILDCSDANSSSDISSALNDAFWFTNRLKMFYLGDDDVVEELSEGVFKRVTFEIIDVENAKVASIHPSALLSSQDHLKVVQIRLCPMKEFPWDTLPQLTSLLALYLKNNRLTAIPSIQSPSLQSLVVSQNRIFKLEAGWQAPNLTALIMSGNPITGFPHGFFEGFDNLVQFDCNSCKLGPTLFNGTLNFRSENLTELSLIHNNISTIEPDAITGLTPNTVIYLEANHITELTEEAFRPMLDVLSYGNGYIDLWDNPIMCGCSMAWVVVEPYYFGRVLGYCHDGNSMEDLDPDVFKKFCIKMNPPMPGEYSTWIDLD
ncbi:unnamed protein product [Darwinula stevensoni]|uniref:Uncharacterized protein n=1 Tax=Darwinula stevensoni TaxID=69355 RepID=A0A7R9A244_9CRUS|nr:unnamed protein product [Darwinula stevensoni]CAG0884911.1 unnamed protein product [Darwinula stevensoni]